MKEQDKNPRRSNTRGTKEDPTVRLNISMPTSTHSTLVALAKQKGVSLSALLCQSTLTPEKEVGSTKLDLNEVQFFKTVIELFGPLTLFELINLLQKHKSKPSEL